jgi:beta-1,4-mannosyltransferase
LHDRPLKRASVQINKDVFFKKYNLDPPKKEELLIVSSTSWTKDEDFSILLNALKSYEASDSTIPIRALITGKGPEK